jgi:hypothetical protein
MKGGLHSSELYDGMSAVHAKKGEELTLFHKETPSWKTQEGVDRLVRPTFGSTVCVWSNRNIPCVQKKGEGGGGIY